MPTDGAQFLESLTPREVALVMRYGEYRRPWYVGKYVCAACGKGFIVNNICVKCREPSIT